MNKRKKTKESKGFEEAPLDLRQIAVLIAMKLKAKRPNNPNI